MSDRREDDVPSPPDAICAAHPGERAAFVCARCGDFGCERCVHRVSPGARPLCASCWSQRQLAAGELARGEGSFRLWILGGVGALLLAWLALVAGTLAGAC